MLFVGTLGCCCKIRLSCSGMGSLCDHGLETYNVIKKSYNKTLVLKYIFYIILFTSIHIPNLYKISKDSVKCKIKVYLKKRQHFGIHLIFIFVRFLLSIHDMLFVHVLSDV